MLLRDFASKDPRADGPPPVTGVLRVRLKYLGSQADVPGMIDTRVRTCDVCGGDARPFVRYQRLEISRCADHLLPASLAMAPENREASSDHLC